MRFFTGLHQPCDAKHFDAAFISVNRIRGRRSHFTVGDWIMDSGAFTEISTYGYYRDAVDVYARQIRRWKECGNLLAAVAQDWMCEPHIIAKTGLSIAVHQSHTIARYDALIDQDPGAYVMPVLQGYAPADYARHVRAYGDRLSAGQWVGVGSVCKRNADPWSVVHVLRAIKAERPDLRLHGFGLKRTALECLEVVRELHSADSMAWSLAARLERGNGNDWRDALRFAREIDAALENGRAFTSAQTMLDLECENSP